VSQNSEGATSPTAVERAEQLWENMEQAIKTFATHAGQSVWQTTTSLPQKLNRTEQPSSPSSGGSTEEAHAPATERAEQVVSAMGQRLSQWTAVAGLQIQRTTARIREDAEDMLAEAQSIRQHNNRP
jgi:hypothetical protein